MTQFIASAAGNGGLIIGLDDLHAADEASLRLLCHLAGELRGSKVLLVGAYRDAEVRSAPHLQRLVSAIARHGRRMVLSGLDPSEVAMLLEHTMAAAVDSAVAQEVHQTTDGNPLFVQEVARLIAPEPDAAGIVLPEEVHHLVRRRLEPAPSFVRDVLEVGAVINDQFDTALLETTSAMDGDTLVDALEQSVGLGVIVELEAGRWAFVHEVAREAVYDDIRASRRVLLHRRVGEALEQVHADEQRPHVAELAHHFFEAARGGDGAKAREYCTLAGDVAMATLAFEDASIQYGRALEALTVSPPVDERERYDLLIRLAEASMRRGDLAQASEFQRRALKSARAVGSAELLGWAAVAFLGERQWIVDEIGASVLAEARAALPQKDDPLLARVLVALAGTGDDRKATADRSNEALAMARRLGDRETLVAVLSEWHRVNYDDPDLIEDRLAVADELLRLCDEAGDTEALAMVRHGAPSICSLPATWRRWLPSWSRRQKRPHSCASLPWSPARVLARRPRPRPGKA